MYGRVVIKYHYIQPRVGPLAPRGDEVARRESVVQVEVFIGDPQVRVIAFQYVVKVEIAFPLDGHVDWPLRLAPGAVPMLRAVYGHPGAALSREPVNQERLLVK